MDLAWTNSLDQLWRSPTFPMWLTLVAAALFAVVFLVIVLRADRSVANGALAVMTLLAVAVAAAAATRGFSSANDATANARAPVEVAASLPALSCIDDLAGDSVEAACEKILFGSPDHVAAAVSYAAARLSRLTALGDVATANKSMTPELQALRRAVERDRYGLMAHVMVVRDGCTTAICPAYQALSDRKQIATNIEQRVYDGLVARYAASWSGDAESAAGESPAAATAAERPSAPTGKPTNAEFPTSASIPPVSIMTPEPPAAAAAASAATAAPTPSPVPRPAAAAKAQSTPHQTTQAKRRPNPPPQQLRSTAPPAPPVQLTPAPASSDR